MAVKLRLTRIGSKKNPIYRVVAADHLADVVGRDVQHQNERAVALLRLHANGRRVVDKLAREIREQLSHCA